MAIPIVIICYNNCRYVANTIKQLIKINPNYKEDIIIVDNASTCAETVDFLKKTEVKTIINDNNNGPWITQTNNGHIWNILPNEFILTDPDLEYNENTPSNFIEILSALSNKYKCKKVGLALRIDDFDKMYQKNNYCDRNNIYDWEIQFWKNKILDNEYELYNAEIDTTFSLINKLYISLNLIIRVAGNFTARHIPWYINNPIYTIDEIILNNKDTKISFTTNMLLS
jgi:hypothetical protein